MSDALEKVLQALIWAAVGMVVLPSAVVMFLSFAETYLKVEFKNDPPRTVAKVAFVTKGFLICPNTGMDIWDECYCAHGERTDNDSQEKGGKKT